MKYSRTYGGVIWTNHALERLQGRKMSQELAWKTFKFPDTEKRGKSAGSQEFQKRHGDYDVTVIAKKNKRSEWIILSCWIEPPLPGSIDTMERSQSPSLLRLIFEGLKKLFTS